jgi:colicin import membrane protein
MPNKWVEHVKKFARDNNLTYGCALSDPNLRKGYVPTGKKAQAKRADEEREKRQDEEEARVSAAKRAEEARVNAAKRAEEERVNDAKRAKGRALEKKYWADVRAKEAAKKMKEEKKYWVFKPPKGALPAALALMKAQRDDLKKPIEGLYKGDDGRAESFTIKDFKEVFLDNTPKPATSQLLKIAKYLQKEELGKIRYLPAPK